MRTVDELWWPLAKIRFDREQMIFLILNMNLLAEGIYPPNPNGTGYTDPAILTKGKAKRPYCETALMLHAELSWRLGQTGISGELLVERVNRIYLELVNQGQGISATDILREVSGEARRALNYISGWARRKQSYTAWKAKTNYRKGIRGNATRR